MLVKPALRRQPAAVQLQRKRDYIGVTITMEYPGLSFATGQDTVYSSPLRANALLRSSARASAAIGRVLFVRIIAVMRG